MVGLNSSYICFHFTFSPLVSIGFSYGQVEACATHFEVSVSHIWLLAFHYLAAPVLEH